MRNLHVVLVKVILTVVKQLEQLQRKPGTNSEAAAGLEPMTSAIYRCDALPTEL